MKKNLKKTMLKVKKSGHVDQEEGALYWNRRKSGRHLMVLQVRKKENKKLKTQCNY